MKAVVIGAEPKLAIPRLGRFRPRRGAARNVAQGLVRFDAAGNIVAGPRGALERQRRWPELHLPDRVGQAGPTARRSPPSKSPGCSSVQLADRSQQSAQGLARRRRRHRRDDRPGDRNPPARPAPQPPVAARPAGIRDPSRNGQGTGPFTAVDRQGGRGGSPRPRDRRRPTRRAPSARKCCLAGAPADNAISDFAGGKVDLVLGGTFADLAAAPPREAAAQ